MVGVAGGCGGDGVGGIVCDNHMVGLYSGTWTFWGVH